MKLLCSSLLRTLIIAAVGAAVLQAAVAGDTRIWIKPGPTVISEEERKIEADPAAGIEHGVILLHETYLNDDYGTSVEKRFHMRAKILSNEARSLADVEIPLGDDEKLTDWWGRTLLPDGTTLEVARENLEKQAIARVGQWRQSAIKAALPGVVPGSVIDYGYTVKGEGRYRSQRILLQKEWPVMRLRYRWRPFAGFGGAYRVHRTEGLDVEIKRDKKSVLVVADDLPPVPEEPYMPPDYEVRASVTLYYLEEGVPYKRYWQEHARRIERLTRQKGNKELVQEAIEAAKAGSDGTPAGELQVAYEWIAANVDNPLFESGRNDPLSSTFDATGTLDPLDLCYIQVARGLGAEAGIVLAPDRTRNFWDPNFMSMRQFAAELVAVRAPGDPEDKAIVVDPSSGLSFGEVPWRVSGVEGFLADPKNPGAVFIPPSSAARNVTRKSVKLEFDDDGSTMFAEWEEFAKGQPGLKKAQILGAADEYDADASSEWMCGAGPDAELVEIESTVAHPPVTTKLSCELEVLLSGIEENVSRYHMYWTGPWVDAIPELPPGSRTHPVVFDYPYVETTEIEIKAPAGFRPSESAEDILVSGPFGKYQVTIAATEQGFTLQRAFALLPVLVAPGEYEEFRAFLNEVREADRTNLIFARED